MHLGHERQPIRYACYYFVKDRHTIIMEPLFWWITVSRGACVSEARYRSPPTSKLRYLLSRPRKKLLHRLNIFLSHHNGSRWNMFTPQRLGFTVHYVAALVLPRPLLLRGYYQRQKAVLHSEKMFGVSKELWSQVVARRKSL